MLKSNDAYGNFVELQSSYLAANGFTCEDASWDHTVAYLSDTTKVGIRSLFSHHHYVHHHHHLYPIRCHIWLSFAINSTYIIIIIQIIIFIIIINDQHHHHLLFIPCLHCRVHLTMLVRGHTKLAMNLDTSKLQVSLYFHHLSLSKFIIINNNIILITIIIVIIIVIIVIIIIFLMSLDSKNQPFHSWYLLDLDFYRKLCFEGTVCPIK
jgi:hypothetical protein